MKLDPHDIELIEKSIDGTLSSEESLVFEEKYQSSEAFREGVSFQRALLSSLDAKRKAELKAELTQMLREVDEDVKVVPISNRWYMLAASIAVILGVVWVFGLTGSSDALFQAYFEPFPAQGFVRGEIPENKSDEILKLYIEERHTEVINLIKELDAAESFQGQFIYLGNSYLVISEYDKAIETFESVDESNKYYPDSQWYLALAYLANDESNKAAQTLKNLSGQNTIYTTSAKNLLRDMK